MKTTDTITTLFSHNLWANMRLLERCSQLTSEQLEKSIPGSYGAIQDTLRHIVRAERSYFARISTGQPYRSGEDEPPMTMEKMMESARRSGLGLIEWAPKVAPDDMVTVDWDGTPREVPKTIILTQAIYHAIEHRAQIMVTMTQLGIEPPDLQGWEYFDEVDQ
jgi:uncharacterized damage-inducible protein DinB